MRQMPQQMLKYLSRTRRKQDLNKTAITNSKRLTAKFFESLRNPEQPFCSLRYGNTVFEIRRRCGLTNDAVLYRTVRYRTVLCD
jgi:hypothetical protein